MGADLRTPLELRWSLAGRSERIELAGERAVLGRSSQCDVVLRDQSISRRHAELVHDGRGWIVRDLGSFNGVLVNGRRVSEQRLEGGEVIRLGSVDLRCELPRSPDTSLREVVFSEASIEGLEKEVIDMDTFSQLLEREPKAAPGARAPAPPTGAGAPQKKATALPEGAWIVQPLREAAEALLTGQELEQILAKFLDLVARQLRAQRGFIGLRDERSGELVSRVTWAEARQEGGPITISRTIASMALDQRQSVLVHDTAADQRFAEVASILSMQIRSAMCAPLYRAGQVIGLIYVDSQSAVEPFTNASLQMLSILATLAAVAVEETRLKEAVAREQRIRERLARYSSAPIVDEIVHRLKEGETGEGAMRAAEREVSVLFCDFAGFTSLAESLEPAAVTQLLNAAFERLTAAVFAEGGTLDKFTGDGMMVFFGAPIEQPDHAERAVRTALRMQQALLEPAPEGVRLPPLKLRIGVNSGRAVVGDIGTPQRRDYTAVGDAVNVASRLESSVARPGEIVIGPGTWELVKERFDCRPLEARALRGKQKPVQPWLVVGPRPAQAEPPAPSP